MINALESISRLTRVLKTWSALSQLGNRYIYTFTYMLGFTEMIKDTIFMDPCIVDYSVEIPTRCSFVIEFIIP
jgi:hypothetical protein